MAKQIGLILFTGKLGNLIGYRREGNYYVRSMPETVRQTTATKQAAQNFGIISRKAKLIRHSILPHLNMPRDGSLVNRLNKALLLSNSDISHSIKSFRMNSYTGVEQFFCMQPVVTPQGVLKIPAQSLPPQANATHLEIKMISVRINFPEHQVTGSSTATTLIDTRQPFDGVSLEASVPGKGTLLVVLQIRCFNGSIAMENHHYYAANVLAAITPRPTKSKPPKTNHLPALKRLLSPLSWPRQVNILRPVTIIQRE